MAQKSRPSGNAARWDGARVSRSVRQQSILQVAARLFRQRGYHGTSIRDIGAEAGVTSAALYRHFENKDAILEAALWEFARHVRAASLAAIDAAEPSPRAVLRELVRAFVRVALEERDFLAAYLYEARHLKPEVYAEMQRSDRAYRDRWMHQLCLCRPELSETRAATVARVAVMMASHGCLEDPELDAEQLTDLLVDMAVAAMLESFPPVGSRRPASAARTSE